MSQHSEMYTLNRKYLGVPFLANSNFYESPGPCEYIVRLWEPAGKMRPAVMFRDAFDYVHSAVNMPAGVAYLITLDLHYSIPPLIRSYLGFIGRISKDSAKLIVRAIFVLTEGLLVQTSAHR